MKGFKKDGKFIPTGNRYRSPLTVSQFRKFSESQFRDKGTLRMEQGFKVYPNTSVSVDSDEIQPEIVERVQNLWNTDPHIRKLRKHVNVIEMNQDDPDSRNNGQWDEVEKKFIIAEDYSPLEAELTTVHEVVGHAFWDWARKWRREELIEFNELANSLPPISVYVKKYEKKWRKVNDDYDKLEQLEDDYNGVIDIYNNEMPNPNEKYQDILDDLTEQTNEIENDEGHQSMTRYANEQHSAMTELIYGIGEKERKVFLDDNQLETLTDAWYKLHY